MYKLILYMVCQTYKLWVWFASTVPVVLKSPPYVLNIWLYTKKDACGRVLICKIITDTFQISI